MNKTKLFPVLFAVLLLAVFAAPANATDLDATTCTDIIGGHWVYGNTCTYNMSYNISSVITLNINNGITLQGGFLANFGTININDGGIFESWVVYNEGTIFNACGGTFTIETLNGVPVQSES